MLKLIKTNLSKKKEKNLMIIKYFSPIAKNSLLGKNDSSQRAAKWSIKKSQDLVWVQGSKAVIAKI